MTFSFNASWSLKISLITLALLGAEQKGYASCAEDDGDNSEILASSSAVLSSERPAAAVEMQDEDRDSEVLSIVDLPLSIIDLPPEMIDNILSHLDLPSLTAARQTCHLFENIVKKHAFQQNYCGFTFQEYENIMEVQLPTIFGYSRGKIIGEFFQEKLLYSYDKLLRDLLSKENVARLQENDNALIKQLFPFQGGAILLDSVSLAKGLTIASQASKLFIENVETHLVIKAFAPLSVEWIQAFADVMTTQQVNDLFTENMNGYARSLIVAAFAPLRPEQIQVIAQQAGNLFTENMGGYARSLIIKAFAPLSIEWIQAFADVMTTQQVNDLFTENMSGYDRSLITAALAPLRPEQIQAIAKFIAQQAGNIFTENMTEHDRAKAIEALVLLGVEEFTTG